MVTGEASEGSDETEQAIKTFEDAYSRVAKRPSDTKYERIEGIQIAKTGYNFYALLLDGQVEIPTMRELKCECKRKTKVYLVDVVPSPLWLGRCPRCRTINFVTSPEAAKLLTYRKAKAYLKLAKKGGLSEDKIQELSKNQPWVKKI